jgi:hypothetical protein
VDDLNLNVNNCHKISDLELVIDKNGVNKRQYNDEHFVVGAPQSGQWMKNPIDHICINKTWRASLLDFRKSTQMMPKWVPISVVAETEDRQR